MGNVRKFVFECFVRSEAIRGDNHNKIITSLLFMQIRFMDETILMCGGHKLLWLLEIFGV